MKPWMSVMRLGCVIGMAVCMEPQVVFHLDRNENPLKRSGKIDRLRKKELGNLSCSLRMKVLTLLSRPSKTQASRRVEFDAF